MPKIEEDGKSWLRRSKLYKGVVEPYKKKKKKKFVYIHYAYGKKNHPHSSPNSLTIGQGGTRHRGGGQAYDSTSEELLLKLKCW